MTRRIEQGVERGSRITIFVDGAPVAAFAGETLATALIASGRIAFRRDGRAALRGLFCNMGTCSECFVQTAVPGRAPRRLRACLTPVADGMAIETGAGPDG
ncbi:(2Fe-2S)-binding protein [Flavisphingomonas formosensis]|uniref:(2Fe-2S)-binding protein n=1 Tax=Flavisphingomonas formosensis TaxID=861534 RepID=UPI0012F70EA3|nr:(2Fe-2S)-binding protein [Sphingomonas formosensis]